MNVTLLWWCFYFQILTLMRRFDIDNQVTEILLEAIAAASEEQQQTPIPYSERRVSTQLKYGSKSIQTSLILR